MPKPLTQVWKPWKVAAASLALFLALPTLGYAQTNNSVPPLSGLPSAQMETCPVGPVPGSFMPTALAPAGPLTGDPTTCSSGNSGSGGPNCPGPDEHGMVETIAKSICVKYDSSCYTPLVLDSFFEGWLTPWISPGAGSGGAYRVGWVNSPDGFFRREFDQLYSYTSGHSGMPNEQIGETLLYLPLSRRLEVAIFVPYVDSLGRGKTTFGDMLVVGRVMLIETKDLGVTSGMTVRTPTGSTSTGNGQTDVDPFWEIWADLGRGWQVRAGMDVNVPLDRMPGVPDADLTASLAVGKSFTGPLGEFTPYLATNFHEAFNTASASGPAVAIGQGAARSYQVLPAGSSGVLRDLAHFELTPGIHAHLVQGKNLDVNFLWGITIPVVAPRSFDTNNQFYLVLAW